MRFIHLDEAGCGSIEQDPHFVVAGVITNPDRDWVEIGRHLRLQAFAAFEGNVPKEFFFHAKDLWHGSGFFPRRRFTRAHRLEILDRLVNAVLLFQVPICVGPVGRASVREKYPNVKDARVFEHAVAFMTALKLADWWMINKCPGEVASVIAENRAEVRQALSKLHIVTQDYHISSDANLKTVVEALCFAAKRESPILQLSDLCAFLIKRKMDGCPHVRPLYEKIEPNIIKPGKDFFMTMFSR